MTIASKIEKLLSDTKPFDINKKKKFTIVSLKHSNGYSLIFTTKKIKSGQFKNSYSTSYHLKTPDGKNLSQPYESETPVHWKIGNIPRILDNNLSTIVNNLVTYSGWHLEV